MRRGGIGFFQVSRAIPADGKEPFRERDLPLPTQPLEALAEGLRHGLGSRCPVSLASLCANRWASSFSMLSAIDCFYRGLNCILPW